VIAYLNVGDRHCEMVCIACDCAKLPVVDECIDAVVSCAGFESMQDKMMDGFREGYRVLKKDGNAIYSISVVEDHNSENTQKWERLYRTLPESFHLHAHLNDIQEWKEICHETGYESTAVKQIYGEMPAPKDEIFPFEQEVMQWMGEYLCISRK